MGTRSLTHIREEEAGHDLLCIYRQFDGYPSGIGKDLFSLLSGYQLKNGFMMSDADCAKCGKSKLEHKDAAHTFESKRVANGMGCLAATIVKGLKDEIGNVYIQAPDTTDAGQEYEYYIWAKGSAVMLKVRKGYGAEWETIYSGPMDAFDPEAAETVSA